MAFHDFNLLQLNINTGIMLCNLLETKNNFLSHAYTYYYTYCSLIHENTATPKYEKAGECYKGMIREINMETRRSTSSTASQ